jgi:hypothetical protein
MEWEVLKEVVERRKGRLLVVDWVLALEVQGHFDSQREQVVVVQELALELVCLCFQTTWKRILEVVLVVVQVVQVVEVVELVEMIEQLGLVVLVSISQR